jgi:RsiW-degrading membrane proteinase PrsW (M82 family)
LVANDITQVIWAGLAVGLVFDYNQLEDLLPTSHVVSFILSIAVNMGCILLAIGMYKAKQMRPRK